MQSLTKNSFGKNESRSGRFRLYGCIISPGTKKDKDILLSIAQQFSYRIEILEDGVLFDVSGLERLIGDTDSIAQNILAQLKTNNIPGNVAVAATVDSAILLARQEKELNQTIASPTEFANLPLRDLEIENASIGIFNDLGIHTIEDLRQIPVDDLINRYGQDFRKIIDVIEQRGKSFVTPNVKENNAAWNFELDFPVDDFEQLIFIVNHGLDQLFRQVAAFGFSTEQLDISFKLSDKTVRNYEIKTSFPTLDKTFWLKLINLRIALDAPEAAIMSVNVVSHFTRPRPDQKGLYAASRPEPESLLLTANKLKKLVGEENVGVPILLDRRVAEPFALDAEKLPDVRAENISSRLSRIAVRRSSASPADALLSSAAAPPVPSVAFVWYRPPARAEALVHDGRLAFIKTKYFAGRVTEYSGVWRTNSTWWNEPWKVEEWDIEVENQGVYRLCRSGKEWFLMGEYD
jgi:protein ImuB